jgi:O-antigen/teichoic acid export membrane protein
VAFGMVMSDPLIDVLYGDEYEEASMVFAVCLAGAALITSAQGASSLLMSADRQRAVLGVVIVCGVLKIGLDAWLIHIDGLRGALIAYALVAAVNVISYTTLAIRACGAAPDWRRLGRTILASALAASPLLLVHHHLPALAELLVGGALATLYLPITLMLGCWTRNDIAHMQQLHQRLLRGRPRFGARLLEWAHARAPVVAPIATGVSS